MATIQSNSDFFALLNVLDDDVSKALEKEKAAVKAKDSSRPSTADKEKKGKNVNNYDILASFSWHLQLNEEPDLVSLSANRKANSFALLDDKESDNEERDKLPTNLQECMADKAEYSSMPSAAMTETEKKKLKKIEKAENKKLKKINKAEKKKQKKIVKAESENDVRTENGSGSGCKSPVSARSSVKGKDGKVVGNKKYDNERGAKAQAVNANWNPHGKGRKLNEGSNNSTGNKDHTINGGRSYNNRRVVDKRHKANFPGRGIVLGCGVVKDTGDDQPKSNGQEAGFDAMIVKSHTNERKSGIPVVEGIGGDESNGQEVGSEGNWTEIKSQKNQRKSSKVNCKAVVKGTSDEQSNGLEAFFDEEWIEIMSHKNQRKYDSSNGQGADFDEMWKNIIESHKIQRKSSDGNWDLYGRGRRLNEEAGDLESGYATSNRWDLCGRGRRLNE
ncbi:hypothetical protein LguiA_011773 [Lonicera macranthoides]